MHGVPCGNGESLSGAPAISAHEKRSAESRSGAWISPFCKAPALAGRCARLMQEDEFPTHTRIQPGIRKGFAAGSRMTGRMPGRRCFTGETPPTEIPVCSTRGQAWSAGFAPNACPDTAGHLAGTYPANLFLRGGSRALRQKQKSRRAFIPCGISFSAYLVPKGRVELPCRCQH